MHSWNGLHISSELRRQRQEQQLFGQLQHIYRRTGAQRDGLAALPNLQRKVPVVLRSQGNSIPSHSG